MRMRVETTTVFIIDTITGNIEKTACTSRSWFIEKDSLTEDMVLMHKFTATELSSGTLALGKKAPWMAPGEEAVVSINGNNCGVGKVHNSVFGRIDGLTRLYRDYLCPNIKIGDIVEINVMRKPDIWNNFMTLRINISTKTLNDSENYK